MLKPQPLVFQNVIVSSDKVFKAMIKLKLLGWALIQSERHLYKKRKRYWGCAHTEERPHEGKAKRWPSSIQ